MPIWGRIPSGFLYRILRDSTANTIAIAAAALIPLTALIGGGIDVSRAYMAKTQLQSACDAGVLAGRRAMSKSGEYGDDERDKADAMFDFNFDGHAIDVIEVNFDTADNDDGQVTGSATAKVPTLVMKAFDKDSLDLEVDCMAELQIGNADVMFVLDVTHSMGESIGWGGPSKLDGLRDAVMDFHRTVNQAINDNRTRVRYGFVPYAMTVNASELLTSGEMPYSYFADEAPYQTRLAVYNDPVLTPSTETLSEENETYESEIRREDCYDYADNEYPENGHNPVRQGSSPDPVTTTEYDYVDWEKTREVGRKKNKYWVGWCTRRKWVTQTTYTTEYEFSTWRYTQADLDTSQAKTFGSVAYVSSVGSDSRVATRGAYDPIELAEMAANGEVDDVTVRNSTWNGCLEARDTVQETNFDPIPDDAYDLDFDLVPQDEYTEWQPHWSDLEFSRSATGSNYSYQDTNTNRSHVTDYCPTPMKLLTEVELSDDPDEVPEWLDDYLDDLNLAGYTYHDVGMVWGGRLTSPTGLFADNVNLDADKISVSKHIIFMTDGIMQPEIGEYSAYGIEKLDNRISPRYSEDTITDRHNSRFSAVCEEIKAQGTTIWVVAFGTSMTDELRDCASNGRAYYSSNTEELRNTFKFIAAQVADLRLGA
jgi:Flp pilus assembly protein TadG